MEEADHELIRVRFEVVRLLGRLRNREAAPALITALAGQVRHGGRGRRLEPRRAAGSAQAVEPMLRYAGEASKEVRKEVVQGPRPLLQRFPGVGGQGLGLPGGVPAPSRTRPRG